MLKRYFSSRKSFELLILVSYVQLVSGTCYTRFNSTQPYSVIGSDTVESQRGCEVLCTANSQCTAFAFSPRGLQSWCALLGNPSTNTCTEPKEVFLRKEQGCPARTNITAEFGEDPCVDEIELPRGSAPICALDSSKRLIIRVIAENGSRMTLDNDVLNQLSFANDMWTISYSNSPYFYSLRVVALVCASAGSDKCGCDPLPFLSIPGGVPARTDTIGPCANSSHRLHVTVFHCSGQACERPGPVSAASMAGCAQLKCQAGAWMFWTCGNNGLFRVTSAACAP